MSSITRIASTFCLTLRTALDNTRKQTHGPLFRFLGHFWLEFLTEGMWLTYKASALLVHLDGMWFALRPENC